MSTVFWDFRNIGREGVGPARFVELPSVDAPSGGDSTPGGKQL
jgi:hypothetical protein